MKYILTLEYTTLAGLQDAVKLLEGEVVGVQAVRATPTVELKAEHAPEVEAPKRGRGRPPKGDGEVLAASTPAPAPKAAATPPPVAAPVHDFGFDVPAAPAKVLSYETDIIPAFQAYAKRNSRDAAIAVLTHYGVKSVRELPTSVFQEVMEKLG